MCSLSSEMAPCTWVVQEAEGSRHSTRSVSEVSEYEALVSVQSWL